MNANNRRIGENHRRWFRRGSATPGSAAHFLASHAELLSGKPSVARLVTVKNGGSSSQLLRGWGDGLISAAASACGGELSRPASEVAERAFGIARRIMGLGRRAERVGAAATSPAPAQPCSGAERFVACLELDLDADAQRVFARMAIDALRRGGSTHLGVHAGYGRENGYRGEHSMISLDALERAELRAESRCEGRGAAVRVVACLGAERFPLVSFKRKGGDGPSERYPDQMQVALLVRGARALAERLEGSVGLRDTGRRVVETIAPARPRELAEA